MKWLSRVDSTIYLRLDAPISLSQSLYGTARNDLALRLESWIKLHTYDVGKISLGYLKKL